MSHRERGMRVAVIGSGVAGLSAAWVLARRHPVSLFEANATLGGHANTVDVSIGGVSHPVDTGFLVFNHRTYPNLTALFEHLSVATAASEMSFSVSFDAPDLEWSGTDLSAVFTQRRNLLRPRFLGMLADIVRFNRAATAIAAAGGACALAGGASSLNESLGEFLDRGRYGSAFRNWYLLPMAGAIWSCPNATMLDYPLVTFAQFCANHGLLQVTDRPQWYTVDGGSRTYVNRLAEGLPDVRIATPVTRIRRVSHGVEVVSASGVERFDAVVLACHSDQALAMLDAPTPAQASVLGRISYQSNHAVLHTDVAFLPRRRRAWAAWNYQATQPAIGSASSLHAVGVNYWLNRLQPLPFEQQLVLSMNPIRAPRDETVLRRFEYAHPVFDRAAIAAQSELAAIQGAGGIWFCGAWTGYGFHEDGLKSGLAVANALGEYAPWQRRPPAPRVEAIGATIGATIGVKRPTADLVAAPRAFAAQVLHRRLRPRANEFRYPVFFVTLPLSRLRDAANRWFSVNRWNLLSFHFKDYGPGDGRAPREWLDELLTNAGLPAAKTGEIVLQTFPRVLGYAFNPVSFWYCYDDTVGLRAVVCEVNNTFGERHMYLLAHADARPIEAGVTLEARKVFHVSPFLPIEGSYRFRFRLGADRTLARIDYFDAAGDLLNTSISGVGRAWSASGLARLALAHGWMTLAIIARIHYQAVVLFAKRVPFFRKPQPPNTALTRSIEARPADPH